MRRLLLFTYHYPPKPAAGSLRPFYLAKYLVDYGWMTTIVTPLVATPFGPTIRTRTIRQKMAALAPSFAKNLFRNLVCFPDDAVFWLGSALRQSSRAFRTHNFDAVVSTAMPASTHIAGALTGKRFAIPWIADYRDLWTANPYREIGPVRGWLEPRLERYLLRQASSITSVSQNFVDPLKMLAPLTPVHVIPNAFDPQDWQLIADSRPAEFRFCFGGQLYDGRRSPELLFSTIAALRDNGEPAGVQAKLDFYGPDLRMIPSMATRFGLNSAITLHGLVDRTKMLTAQRNSAVLLVLLRSDSATAGEYGSKIFEYMGAKRPVLAIGGADSVVKALVESNGLGFFASNFEQCTTAIKSLYDRFSKGDFEPHMSSSFEPFTARNLAADFADVLTEAVTRTGKSVSR